MPLAIEVVAPIIVTTLADGIYPGADALLEYMPPAIEVVALIILTALEDGIYPVDLTKNTIIITAEVPSAYSGFQSLRALFGRTRWFNLSLKFFVDRGFCSTLRSFLRLKLVFYFSATFTNRIKFPI